MESTRLDERRSSFAFLVEPVNDEPLPEAVSQPRALPHARAISIALRTAHIAVSGIVVGGHVFQIATDRIQIWLYLTVLTGVMLVVIEAYPSYRWFYQARGAMVLFKLVLLCLIPWLWAYRVYLLVAVIVIASVGSHMPARFRYYSFVHRRVLDH